jgi:hypothetical protein
MLPLIHSNYSDLLNKKLMLTLIIKKNNISLDFNWGYLWEKKRLLEKI